MFESPIYNNKVEKEVEEEVEKEVEEEVEEEVEKKIKTDNINKIILKEEIKQELEDELINNNNKNIKEEIKKNVKDNIIIDKTKKEIKKDLNKKFGGLTVNQWGWLSMITNLLSVFFQLYNLFKTRSARSFSMKFIFLMIILNFWYFLVAILQENIGFAIATFTFVMYNCSVVYFYYYGK